MAAAAGRGGEERREERGVAGREGRAYFHARPRGERRREGGHVAKNKLGSHACEGGHTGDSLFLGAVWPLPFFRSSSARTSPPLPVSSPSSPRFVFSAASLSSSSFLNGDRLRLDDRPYACIRKTAFGAG